MSYYSLTIYDVEAHFDDLQMYLYIFCLILSFCLVIVRGTIN
jgi:hypothetical protein